MRPEMFNPDFLLAHIEQDTKFDAKLLGQIIDEWKSYRATGLMPDEVSDLMIANGEKEGCGYCSGNTAIPLETDVGKTWIKGDALQNCYGACKIKFCPMCGRKLGCGEKHER